VIELAPKTVARLGQPIIEFGVARELQDGLEVALYIVRLRFHASRSQDFQGRYDGVGDEGTAGENGFRRRHRETFRERTSGWNDRCVASPVNIAKLAQRGPASDTHDVA